MEGNVGERRAGTAPRSVMRRVICLAWMSVFVSSFMWYTIVPVLHPIRETLGLSKFILWKSSVYGVSCTIFVRLVIGPLCDVVGARIVMTTLLIGSAVASASVGLVDDEYGLYAVRILIGGSAGAVFAVALYWGFQTMIMCASQQSSSSSSSSPLAGVGTVGALIGGALSLGAAITQRYVSNVIFPGLKLSFDGDEEKAWRLVGVIPAGLGIVMAVLIFFLGAGKKMQPHRNSSDDQDRQVARIHSGNNRRGRSLLDTYGNIRVNINTWALFLQHAACMGAELTLTNFTVLYVRIELSIASEAAAHSVRLLPWLHIVWRVAGGFLSDVLNRKFGIRGRILLQTVLLLVVGLSVLLFEQSKTLRATKIVMYISVFCAQAAQGSTFAMVPHVVANHHGVGLGYVVGIVAAGGNAGALCFGLPFRYIYDFTTCMNIMGGITLWSTLLGSVLLYFFLDNDPPAAAIMQQQETRNDDEEHALQDEKTSLQGVGSEVPP